MGKMNKGLGKIKNYMAEEEEEMEGERAPVTAPSLLARTKRLVRRTAMDVREVISEIAESDVKRASDKSAQKLQQAVSGTGDTAQAAAALTVAESAAAHGKVSALTDAVDEIAQSQNAIARTIRDVVEGMAGVGLLPDSMEASLKNGIAWINGKRWDLTVPFTSVLVNHTAVITDELPESASFSDRLYGPNPASIFQFDVGRIAASAVTLDGTAFAATISTLYDPAVHTHILAAHVGAATGIGSVSLVPIATLFPALAKGTAFPNKLPEGYINPVGPVIGEALAPGGSFKSLSTTTAGMQLFSCKKQRISHDVKGVLTVLVTSGFAAATDLVGKLPLALPDLIPGLLKAPGSTQVTR